MTAATSLQREILDLEKQYWEACKKAEPKDLSRLTDEKFTFVMSEGILQFDRAGLVEMMTKEGMKITGYSLDEESAKVHDLGPDVALLAYKSHIEYDEGGEHRAGNSYTTSVWVRRGGTWRCASAIDTPLSKK